jgi:hypothetical protein
MNGDPELAERRSQRLQRRAQQYHESPAYNHYRAAGHARPSKAIGMAPDKRPIRVCGGHFFSDFCDSTRFPRTFYC